MGLLGGSGGLSKYFKPQDNSVYYMALRVLSLLTTSPFHDPPSTVPLILLLKLIQILILSHTNVSTKTVSSIFR